MSNYDYHDQDFGFPDDLLAHDPEETFYHDTTYLEYGLIWKWLYGHLAASKNQSFLNLDFQSNQLGLIEVDILQDSHAYKHMASNRVKFGDKNCVDLDIFDSGFMTSFKRKMYSYFTLTYPSFSFDILPELRISFTNYHFGINRVSTSSDLVIISYISYNYDTLIDREDSIFFRYMILIFSSIFINKSVPLSRNLQDFYDLKMDLKDCFHRIVEMVIKGRNFRADIYSYSLIIRRLSALANLDLKTVMVESDMVYLGLHRPVDYHYDFNISFV